MVKFTDQFEKLDLGIHGVRLPSFEVSKEDKRKLGVSEDISNEDFLEAICEAGREKIWSDVHKKHKSEYAQRIDYELKTVKDLGFVDYLLLVWEVINYCKKEKIPTGIGRGSAAGSLLLYLMGVTKIDPLQYGLYF
jgi:DNA polymerase-3 subunit alpha